MAPLSLTVRHFALPLVVAVLCLCTQGDHDAPAAPAAMAFPAVMPQTVVWAWEEPEDLRAAPASVGIAYLAETLFASNPTHARPGASALTIVNRHQPLAVAPGAAVMAVVRVIALRGFQDSTSLRKQTAEALAEVAQRPGLRALQIDFDATRSQRAFYAAVLSQLRPRMPAAMPLSITALVSWCATGPGGWLATLPIDEAVPMFFRLGGSARPGDDKSGYRLREPLCRGSIGISTDESWPPLSPGARLYVFAPRPWTPLELAALPAVLSGRRVPEFQYDSAQKLPPNDTGLPPARFPAASPSEGPAEENLP